jgi:hypothetical protein
LASFGFLPITTPARLRALTALAGATADKFALELGQTTQDGQHEPAVRRSGISPSVPQRLEASGFPRAELGLFFNQISGGMSVGLKTQTSAAGAIVSFSPLFSRD